MPRKPPRPCRNRGCVELTHHTSGYCEAHRAESRSYDRHRGTAAQRGYDHRWKKIRDLYLSHHPLCEQCGEPGQLVDHIRPLADGGTEEDENLQALCRTCHARKTWDDKRRKK